MVAFLDLIVHLIYSSKFLPLKMVFFNPIPETVAFQCEIPWQLLIEHTRIPLLNKGFHTVDWKITDG